MTQHRLPGSPPIALTLRRSSRARRISLRVSRLDGRVTLTLPQGLDEREALAFAESRQDWIRGHLADRPDEVTVASGACLPVEGVPRRVVAGAGRGIGLQGDEIHVRAGAGQGARLRAFLIQLARDRLSAASDDYAAALGRPYSRLTLRDTRSRWGSCSAAGNLMYSWRLILAPPAVLRYVAAHEVAHLAEMNHSAAFWAQVERLYGDYAPPRDWLREEGPALHRYRF